MKIDSIEYEIHRLKLEEPYQIAYETIGRSDNITLKVITDKGILGWLF